jgi:hypothetical protein
MLTQVGIVLRGESVVRIVASGAGGKTVTRETGNEINEFLFLWG